MDAGPFAALLNPELLGLLTLQPIVLQHIKARAAWLDGPKTAVLSFIIAAVMVANHQLNIATPASLMAWLLLASQCAIGWFYTELIYTKVVAPMAESTNPLMPSNPTPKTGGTE